MRQRGRVSAAAFSIAPTRELYSADPPDYLSAAQKEIWQTAVDRLGHDWFPAEVLPLLEQYCCVVVVTRSLSRQVDDSKLSPGERTEVMRQWHTYTSLMLQLATKLRITTQSTQTKSKSKPKVNTPSATAKKPWTTASED